MCLLPTYLLSGAAGANSLIQVAGEIPVLNLPAWVAALQSMANQLEAAHKMCASLLEYAGPGIGQTNARGHAGLGNLATQRAAVMVFGGTCSAEAALPLPQAAGRDLQRMPFVFARASPAERRGCDRPDAQRRRQRGA